MCVCVCVSLLICWITCQIRSKIGKFGKKLNFLPHLAWNSKKSAKIRKNEKTQHLIRCLKSKKPFKINFQNFCQFLAYFEQKMAKNMFFVIFSKTEFWSKFDIANVFLVKFPFWKCILLCTFMNSFKLENKNAQTWHVVPLMCFGRYFCIPTFYNNNIL